MSDHSTFSPSSADRWMVCQESLIPLEGLHYSAESEDSGFARDGTAKHKLAEWALTNNEDTVNALLMDMAFAGLTVTTDMVEAADVYVNAVREVLRNPDYGMLELEARVHMPTIHEDMYGTLDCRIFSERKKHLIIGDAKFGWERKDATTWQLRAYAVGACNDLEDQGYEVETITCFIVQPLDTFEQVKLVTYTRAEVKKFAAQMKKATKGNAIQAGTHCKYCQRAPVCQALQDFSEEAFAPVVDDVQDIRATVSNLTPAQINTILNRQEAVGIWFAAVAAYAKQLAMLGEKFEDWELSQGQGNRRYKDTNEAERLLLNRFGDGIYEPRVLRSPAQIEKIWPKAKVIMKELTERPKSGQVLKRKNAC